MYTPYIFFKSKNLYYVFTGKNFALSLITNETPMYIEIKNSGMTEEYFKTIPIAKWLEFINNYPEAELYLALDKDTGNVVTKSYEIIGKVDENGSRIPLEGHYFGNSVERINIRW